MPNAAAAIATPHPQATIAARDVLRDGGNAFDAAVAAMLTLCVVQSHQVGLGGYGGTLVARVAGEERVIAIDFDSRAPLAFTPDAFANAGDRTVGYRSITVPAILAGLQLALKTYGTMGWPRVTAQAICCAEEGFVLDEATSALLDAWAAKADADSRAALFPDGTIPHAGELWVQKALGRLLRQIAEEGPEVFYRGDIAQTVIRHVRSHGGILSDRDFAEYEARAVEPIAVNYRGLDVYTPPPPAGGLTMLQILKTLENFDLAEMTPWSADYFHLLAQAAKLCWQDRIRALGDPDLIEIPPMELLSEKSAQEKARRISRGALGPTQAMPPERPCTANVCVMDSPRNVVSITATQGVYFGSGVAIPGIGLLMNHGMSRFDFPPPADHPNTPRPGKRMQHNMAPTIVLKKGQPRFAMGLPGGTKIITVTAQLAIDLIDFGVSARQAVFAPRIHTLGNEPIAVSSAVSDAIIDQLKVLGHRVIRGQTDGPALEIAGNANVLSYDPATAKLEAASQASDDSAAVI
jgi:gamma-glutamyltranspeptidase / glutathione hydrolase